MRNEPLPYTLTLDDVLGVYREVLGSRTLLTNGFIQQVKPMRGGTASISKNGVFYYSPKFFKDWITTPARLRDICTHEMMHPVIGDMTREYDWVANIAADAVINAMLFNMGLCQCEFQRVFYPSTNSVLCLLRPGATPPDELIPMYAALYPKQIADAPYYASNPLEFANAIRIVVPTDQDSWDMLLGSHYRGDKPGDELIDWEGNLIILDDMSMPGEVQGDLADHLQQYVEYIDEGTGGHVSTLGSITASILKSKRSLRTEVVKGFSSKNTLNKLRQYFTAKRSRRTVVPLKITRAQAMQIAAGRPPLFYETTSESDEAISKQGIDFYVDVSGSVANHLPMIIGLFRKLRNDIRSVLVFSNAVAEISMRDFAAGKYRSTGGTDFDCVIRDAVARRTRKVLVITDGCADATEASKELAQRHIDRMGVVFFGGYRDDGNWISHRYGHSYELEELLG